jgi:dihydroorotase
MQTLTIDQPDDWHLHLRDGPALARTVTDASRYFGRAIIMPNLSPPIVNVSQASAYRDRILSYRPAGSLWQPLMTLYLTDHTQPNDIREASASDYVFAAKLYPAGATTNSASGVTNLDALAPVLAAMEKYQLPLLVHGEVTDDEIDIFDREAVFIERHLQPLTQRFPALKVVLEHITTADAVTFVQQSPNNIAATITAHHLLFNRNHMLAGGIRPHYFCLPILNKNRHQQALIGAATGDSGRFFLGTDSAPHARHKKEAECGCAGCYTAHAALELYAEAFDRAGALPALEGFASHYGPRFYGLPTNKRKLRLTRNQPGCETVAESLAMDGAQLRPLNAGQALQWHADLLA